MKVAGREVEIKKMQNLLENTQSEFLAVYGRRRIGKTYLIREIFKPNIVFECSGFYQKLQKN